MAWAKPMSVRLSEDDPPKAVRRRPASLLSGPDLLSGPYPTSGLLAWLKVRHPRRDPAYLVTLSMVEVLSLKRAYRL